MIQAVTAVDQSTTRTKALAFDANVHCFAKSASEISLSSNQHSFSSDRA